jgi:molybdenum cofactor cytidylyltransferase
MFTISAILCAAGQSSRMAPDHKLLMPYRGSTIIRSVIDELLSSQCQHIIIVLGHMEEALRAAIGQIPEHVTIVTNSDYLLGQTSTIQTGLRQLGIGNTAFMINLADMPLLRARHYDDLIAHYAVQRDMVHHEHSIVRPIVKGIPGHPVIFSNTYRDIIMSNTVDQPNHSGGNLPVDLPIVKMEGCRQVIQNHREFLSAYQSSDEAYIFDADTPLDYSKLLRS